MAYTPTGSHANEYGAVSVFDGENPCTFTARVVATVSGGQFVMASGTDGDLLSSGAQSIAANDISVAPAILYDNVIGIALTNQASGTANYVSVARKGTFLVRSSDVVSGGYPLVFSSGGVCNAASSAVSGTAAAQVWACSIGRALTSADSGLMALIGLNI